MKSCLRCKYADWDKTAAGKLHPSGHGRCKYPWKQTPLPASMYWIGRIAETPCGGHISRKKEFSEHCVYFSRMDEP